MITAGSEPPQDNHQLRTDIAMELLIPPYELYEPYELAHFKPSLVRKVRRVRRGTINLSQKGTTDDTR